MFPYIILQHHLGYRQKREHIKRKLQNDLETPSQLLIELNTIIIEQETGYSYTFPNQSERFIENLCLHHSKDHLASFENTGQIPQKDATITSLDEQ